MGQKYNKKSTKKLMIFHLENVFTTRTIVRKVKLHMTKKKRKESVKYLG